MDLPGNISLINVANWIIGFIISPEELASEVKHNKT